MSNFVITHPITLKIRFLHLDHLVYFWGGFIGFSADVPRQGGKIALRVPELYACAEPTISFEFFPPKTDEAEATLFRETVPVLKTLGPSFISVTYGAGGGTRDRTLRIVNRLRSEFDIESMAHLTCVGSTREMLAAVLDEAHGLGIENILAL